MVSSLSIRFNSSLAIVLWLIAMVLLYRNVDAAQLDYEEYMQRGNAARTRGDWQSAASQFAQAINHPELPKTGMDRVLAHMEYGRAVGVLCQYGEAETFLLRAKAVAEAGNSSMFGVLYELGAVNLAQKKYSDAATYFSLLMPVIERETRTRPPAAVVADAYEKYGLALAATGKPEEAEVRRREAQLVREKNRSPAPAGTITPYGEKCPKP